MLAECFRVPGFQLHGVAVDEKVGAEHATADFLAVGAVAERLLATVSVGPRLGGYRCCTLDWGSPVNRIVHFPHTVKPRSVWKRTGED